MLAGLMLENFKAFGEERQSVPFAPITLIFGENSAGKSAILQALYLLKQSYEGGEGKAVLLPYKEGGIVDLGTFRELIHDHDVARTLMIGVVLSPDKNPTCGSNVSLDYTEYPAVAYRFTRHSEAEDIQLSSLSIGSVGKGREALFEPVPEEWAKGRSDWWDTHFDGLLSLQLEGLCRFPIFSWADVYRCTSTTSDPHFWQSQHECAKQYSNDILRLLDCYRDKHALDDYLHGLLNEDSSFFSSDFTFDEFVERMQRLESEACVELSGLRVTEKYDSPINQILAAFSPERSCDSASRHTGHVKDVRSRLGLNVASLAVQRSAAVGKFLEGLYRIRPLRKSPKRFYVFSGTTPSDVGYDGEFLSDLLFRQPRVLEQTNRLLERFTGYRIETRALHASSQDLYEVRLLDVKRSPPVEVSFADVGQGVSQILPFIVQSIAGTKETIVIEQPEVHIHPSLQAELGELLMRAIIPMDVDDLYWGHPEGWDAHSQVIGPYRKQFIVETHSEHLLLRIQRLVREWELDPNDVSILFVSRGANGSKVERLRLDEEGDFIDEWPGGFFPERLRELRGGNT